jgi:carbon storage regulator
MLVLSRKAGESLVIADDVEVTILSVDGQKVRVGVQAPTSVPVHRKEIYLEIRSQEGRPPAERDPEHEHDAHASAQRRRRRRTG